MNPEKPLINGIPNEGKQLVQILDNNDIKKLESENLIVENTEQNGRFLLNNDRKRKNYLKRRSENVFTRK